MIAQANQNWGKFIIKINKGDKGKILTLVSLLIIIILIFIALSILLNSIQHHSNQMRHNLAFPVPFPCTNILCLLMIVSKLQLSHSLWVRTPDPL